MAGEALMIEVTAPALGAHPFLRGMPAGNLRSSPRAPRTSRSRPGTESSRKAATMGELLGCWWLFPPYRWGVRCP
jgi:hypothetical protein